MWTTPIPSTTSRRLRDRRKTSLKATRLPAVSLLPASPMLPSSRTLPQPFISCSKFSRRRIRVSLLGPRLPDLSRVGRPHIGCPEVEEVAEAPVEGGGVEGEGPERAALSPGLGVRRSLVPHHLTNQIPRRALRYACTVHSCAYYTVYVHKCMLTVHVYKMYMYMYVSRASIFAYMYYTAIHMCMFHSYIHVLVQQSECHGLTHIHVYVVERSPSTQNVAGSNPARGSSLEKKRSCLRA